MMLLDTPNENCSTMSTEVVVPVSKETFLQLPRGAQLVVAYALMNDLFDMELMKTDADMAALVNVGWLTIRPSYGHGIVNGEFPDKVWQAFEAIEDSIMSGISDQEMERFKSRKGKAYPWLW